jgi:acyl carrier protein phosphodiesterase
LQNDRWIFAYANGIMNCLAHLYLSGENTDIMFGNFIGDGVKGKQIANFAPQVQDGISLHRFIDTYTDSHQITADARAIIRPYFRKYSGVVLDVYFDYFLGNQWQKHHDSSLPEFVDNCYLVLDEFEPHMSEKTQHFFKYMKIYNWLLNYSNKQALQQIFGGMARRTPFESNMEQAVVVLNQHHRELELAFEDFFPELKNATMEFSANLLK